MTKPTATIDPASSACLCGDGLPSYTLAETVRDDGSRDYVLVRNDQIAVTPYDPITRDAPHEQSGALPAQYAQRLAHALPLCGRATASGRPCRLPVTNADGACKFQRDRHNAERAGRAQP
jgi:rRNA maturation protein Nop10